MNGAWARELGKAGVLVVANAVPTSRLAGGVHHSLKLDPEQLIGTAHVAGSRAAERSTL